LCFSWSLYTGVDTSTSPLFTPVILTSIIVFISLAVKVYDVKLLKQTIPFPCRLHDSNLGEVCHTAKQMIKTTLIYQQTLSVTGKGTYFPWKRMGVWRYSSTNS
jgi:hypothetical protein